MVRPHPDDARMSDFLQLAQTLAMALKALQMYTAAHPRAQEALAAAHAALTRWLADSARLQFVVTGAKAFADGAVQDGRNPHVATLVRLVSERSVSGFVFEQGVTEGECLAFLQALSLKPQKLEEQGGIEHLLQAADVRRIKVSQIRYQAVHEGEEGAADDPKPPAGQDGPAPVPIEKLLREALLATLSGAPGGPADLGGLGPLGHKLGLGDGTPDADQLALLRQIVMDLAPEAQLRLVAGLATLPEHPAGLTLGLHALAGDLLAAATRSALAGGMSWTRLRGPLEQILRPLPDRESLLRTLVAQLQEAGQDTSHAEAMLRLADWDSLSLEAKLVKALEEGYLFELSVPQRLAFLRELLDLRRFGAFLQIQEALVEALRDDQVEIRLKAAQTLAGVSRWALEPGLPPGSEGALAEALHAHFAWEPDPPVHQWTTEALDALLSSLVPRGDLGRVVSDLRELDELCAFLGEPQPWRLAALERLRGSLVRPAMMDAVVIHI
ncbi:MAG TPA: hypothetical protein VFV26_07805, partial [Geothrix sp.]|nr:hypothetical protein [Geothrix sp.]